MKKWGDLEWTTDEWGRNTLGGVPPKGYADWAWVQHMITSAKPGVGRVAVVLPQGALFRQGVEARIREHVLRSDQIEAVIGLAPNLFYGTGLAACVLVIRLQKAQEKRGKVLFINGEELFKKGRNQNTLESDHVKTLLNAYRAFVDEEGLAHVADLAEIEGNNFNLNIPLYVEPADSGEQLTLEEAVSELEAAHAAAQRSRAALEIELTKWGLGLEGSNK